MKRIPVLVVTICLVAVAVVGCGEEPAAVVPEGTPAGTLQSAPAQGDAAATSVCASNRAMLSSQYSVVQSGASPEADTSFAGVVQRAGAKCPTGGVYSWDATTNKVKCSTHGE